MSNGLKSEANTLKRAADKAMKTDGAHEALGLYIEAGLKYLQCCHQLEQEATEHNSPLKNAAHMYKRTAKFFDDILKIATHDVRSNALLTLPAGVVFCLFVCLFFPSHA